jgi:hypothetical protein
MCSFFKSGRSWIASVCLLLTTVVLGISMAVGADPLPCDLRLYKPQPGLTATVANDMLTVVWKGDHNSELRVRFLIHEGKPTLRELAIRPHRGQWRVLGNDLTPEFQVVSGVRRVTQQQTEPLEHLGVPLTASKLDEIKWDAFWDAPLFTEDEPPLSHKTSIPARESFANHPGMPRKPEEIVRASASFQATGCAVRTNGARLEITFPGARAGIFSGYLQYDIFKGSNLIRQMLVAKTSHPSAAFKYSAGLKGLPVREPSRLVWYDLANKRQENRLGSLLNQSPVTVWSNNRLIAAALPGGSIAAFPPPHSFYWARETEQVLGYGWYRKDSDQAFSFGIQQADQEESPHFNQNYALYSARPDTWQRMPLFLYISPETAERAIEAALTFTNRDRFKPLPGYKVMGSHYHVGLVERLHKLGGLDHRLNDVETLKGIGVNIFGVIDGVRGPARRDLGDNFLAAQAEYYDAARRQSDKDFLVMPNDENSTSGRPYELGGHHDLLLSRPVFWRNDRKPGQPLVEQHPSYGNVYNLGSPADLMEMARRENALISMPHPRSKGSTGYPDAIKEAPHFLDQNYFGLGYRWGMGSDASEIRLGDYRFLTLWDEVNNWMAARKLPPKYALAISEVRSDYGERGKPPYDDAYGLSPVNYLKLDRVPSVDDMSPVINALKKGEYFVTTGEVLLPYFALVGSGNKRIIRAEIEWTFPLDFVEVVWGDGQKTERQIIPTTDLAPFGRKLFEIPFDATGKKWVRLAAWDVATNGAFVQPVDLIKTSE